MAALILPKSYGAGFNIPNKAPQGPVELDFSNPLTRGLRSVFYFGLNNTGLNSNLDLFTKQIYQVGGTAPANTTFGADVNGTHLDCVTTSSGNSYGEIELNTAHFDGLSEITILSGYVRTGNQDAGFGRIISRSNGGSGDDWSTTINAESSNSNVRWRVEGNSLTGSTSLVNGQYYDIGVTYKAGERDIYIDGVSDASDTLNVGALPEDQPVSLLANPTSSIRALTGKLYYNIVYDRVLSQAEVRSFLNNRYQILKPVNAPLYLVSGVAKSVLTGTATATIDEDDITLGGKTVIITVTNDTFVAAGTGPVGSTADTQALIDGFNAASSPTNGWNNEVRDKALTSEIVRTSDTVVTWTIAAQSGYDIDSQETITGTIPAAVLTAASEVISTPTFTIDAVVAGRVMGSLAGIGGLAGPGGLAGIGGGMAG